MYYFLNEDHTYIPCSLMKWANQFNEMDNHVADETINDKRISTIWMGSDHNYFLGQPLLFETMVFGHGNDIYCERYTTWEQAVEGHKKAVQWVLDGCKEDESK